MSTPGSSSVGHNAPGGRQGKNLVLNTKHTNTLITEFQRCIVYFFRTMTLTESDVWNALRAAAFIPGQYLPGRSKAECATILQNIWMDRMWGSLLDSDEFLQYMTSTADENDANPDNLPLTRMSGRQIKDFWWTHRHPNTFTMILLPLCGVLDVNAIENSPVWSSYFRKLYESASTCVHLFLKGARAEPEKHKRMMYDMIKMAAEDFPNLPPVEQVPVLIHDLWASSPIS